MLSIAIYYAVELAIQSAQTENKLDRYQYVGDAIEYKLTISPAKLDADRFKRNLLPPHRDRTTGNAASDYRHAGRIAPSIRSESISLGMDRWGEWHTSMPSEILPEAIDRDRGPWRESIDLLRRGAFRESCDWNDPRPFRWSVPYDNRDNQLRSVVQWTILEHKRQLQSRRFDLTTIQALFQTAKRMGERPSILYLLQGTGARMSVFVASLIG